MAAPIDLSSYKETLIVLAAAGVVVPIVQRLKISPVLGFIVVGMAIGPFALGALAQQQTWLEPFVMTDPKDIAPIAELGVALLLFMIGLELSFERLMMMRRLVFGLGAGQVVLSALAIGFVAYFLLQDIAASVVVGLALALSSTAVIIQVLAEKRQLQKPVGRASFGVLLFQDIAVVPILFAVGVLGASAGDAAWGKFGLALLQATIAIVAIVVLGRILLRPLFRMVAGAGNPESFMAACLLVIMGASLATAIAGLSMAMGALIAGLLLAETEYRRQIEVTIEPFKGLLLGVFLISIGMGIDLVQVMSQPHWFVLAGLALIAVKAVIVAGLGRAFGLPLPTAARAGLLLGPGSEFTFVIIGLAAATGLLAREPADFILALAALTMTSIPLMSRLGDWSAKKLTRNTGAEAIAVLPDAFDETRPRVLICGFGRVGQVVAAMLDKHETPYLAIDGDAKLVSRQRALGRQIAYGDASQIELLKKCDIDHARALVITLDAPSKAGEIVKTARSARPDLLIVARARDAKHAAQLYRDGATDAVPETTEASLVLCEQLLVDLGVPMGYVIASVHDKRAEMRAEIQALAPEAAVRAARLQRVKVSVPPESSS
jgi:CPA2 family monovalent cation:H+ antiporter-2